MNKNLDSMTSIIIVLAIFLVSISVIFSGKLSLDKQLSASIINLVYDDHCTEKAYDKFRDNWNNQCKKEELANKCDLDKSTANELKRDYKESEKDCYR